MRIKFEALTVLELSTFNTQPSDRFAAHKQTDAQSDENIISANSLRSLVGDNKLVN